jgi:signal transduction histidine kinase
MPRRAIIGAALLASAGVWLAGWIANLAGAGGGAMNHVENLGWLGLSLAAAAGSFAAARDPEHRGTRRPFAFLGAGCVAWGLGQLVWTVSELRGVSLPYPSLADVGYMASLPLFAACVFTWPRRARLWTRGALVDWILAGGTIVVLAYSFSLEPVLASEIEGVAWIGVVYPALELAVFGVIAGGLALDRWADRGRLATVAVGVLSLAVVDTTFAIDAVDGSLSLAFDPGWTIAFLALGAASTVPRRRLRASARRVPEFVPTVVVTALLGLAAGVFAMRHLIDESALAAKSFAIGLLMVLAALRVLSVARGQSRQNALLAEAQSELRLAQGSRDRFLVELVNAQERGSRRIADLLHDDVVQQLTALGFRLELEAQRTEQPRLRELAADTGEITASIRRLLIELHPAILDSQGLAPAIDVVAEGLRERGIDVRVSPFPHRLPRETETLAYRLVQEALANVLRHSEAADAEVELRLNDGTLRGRVSDSGSGARPAEHTVEGFGLLVARERVELAGGRFLVESGSSRGTDFLFELPLEHEQPAEVAS